MKEYSTIIEEAWENRTEITSKTHGSIRKAVTKTIEALDCGALRIAEKIPDHPEANYGWVVHQWLKKAILLSFKLNDSALIPAGDLRYYDKITSKFTGWNEAQFRKTGVRVVPPANVRHGAFIGQNTVLMPSFVNIGAYVDNGTMVDSWATVGSCAQIGKNVHLSGGVGIGGVLEPLQANPVVIEDNCFIGARAEVAEGVIVGEGAVLSMGVYVGRSTRIVNRATGEILQGYIPPYSVVVPGALPSKPLPDGSPGPSLYCVVIVKTVDAQTRAKTAINELLRAI